MNKIVRINIKEASWGLFLALFSLAYYFSIADKMSILNITDFGRDLYVSLRSFKGDLYLRDFYYVYGYAMPLIVSFFYKIFGVGIKVYNMVWIIFQVVVIIFTYRIARLALPRYFSFIASFSILLTYYTVPGIEPNHIGGEVFGIISLYLLFKYFDKKSLFYLFLSAVFCGLICGVKLNMGLTTMVSNLLILLLIDSFKDEAIAFSKSSAKNIARYAAVFFFVGILPYLYFFLVSGKYKVIRFFSVWLTHGSQEPFLHLKIYFRNLLKDGFNFGFLTDFLMNNLNVFVFFGLIAATVFLKKSKARAKEKLIIVSIIIFSIFKMHEYVLSQTYLSLTLWFFTPAVILAFWCLKEAAEIKTGIKRAAYLLLVCMNIFILAFCIKSSYKINLNSRYYLPLKRAKVFISNPNDAEIINSAVNYLKPKIKDNEPIQSLFFVSMFEYLLDAKEVFWDTYNGTSEGKILEYSLNDSLGRIRTQQPKYIIVANDQGYPHYLKPENYKVILDYIALHYALDKEFRPRYPLDVGQELYLLRVYRLKDGL